MLSVQSVVNFILAQDLRLLFLAEFLESGIRAQRIPDWIEFKKGRKAIIVRNLQKTLQPWNHAILSLTRTSTDGKEIGVGQELPIRIGKMQPSEQGTRQVQTFQRVRRILYQVPSPDLTSPL